MEPLTLRERLHFACAGALMGQQQEVHAVDRAQAREIRRELAKLKMPPKVRRLIRIVTKPAGAPPK